MTGFVPEKEFSRKIVRQGRRRADRRLSACGCRLAGKATGGRASPFASNGPFDQYQVDSWIAINADNTASIKTGGDLAGHGVGYRVC